MQIQNILYKEFPDRSVILGADLNSAAKCTDYKTLAYPFLINQGLLSAYENLKGEEPAFTSWKFRIDEDNGLVNKGCQPKDKVKEWKYTIDFIFHSSDLKTLAVLELPEEKEIDNLYGRSRQADVTEVEFARKRCLLPNEQCPSDHLPLVCEILLPSQDSVSA